MLELRPKWCVDDEAVSGCVQLGPWIDEHGRETHERNGDHWQPGEGLTLRRDVTLILDKPDVRRMLRLPVGATVGIAARWSCRSTAAAGVHDGGPSPIPLDDQSTLSLTIPSAIAGSVELETVLVVTWFHGSAGTGQCPDGGLIWSDSWSSGRSDARVVLEGSEFRLPVHTVSFRERFGEASDAVWAVDLDPEIELSDLLANVATVYLNRDVLARDFPSPSGDPDAGALPGVARAGINVDVLRLLTVALNESLQEHVPNSTYPEGTVGRILTVNLDSAFGSVAAAIRSCEDEPERFSRLLWSHCAPDSWGTKR